MAPAPQGIITNPSSSKAILHFPQFVKDLATWVLGEPYCYEEIVENLNWSNVECLKFGLSKGLGLGIVFGGCIVKLPQIFVIFKACSTRGISFSSYVLETFAYFITVAYNYREKNAFSTWGEALVIVLQNVLILMLMYYYKRKTIQTILVPLICYSVYYVMAEPELVNENAMSFLMVLTIPVVILSRLPQIFSIFKNSDSGQLSLFTVINYFFGTAARVYTTYQEVDDFLILLGNIIAALLNLILLLQVIYYGNNSEKEQKEKELNEENSVSLVEITVPNQPS